ncbi:hypothetical protein B0H16DRAFT_1323556, partial [Mycena metata]
LSDILAGCFTTIFAVIWVSVYPNVLAPGQSMVKLVFRRLGLMMVAVIAPELIVYFAVRQFYAAKELVQEFAGDTNITLTQGFFFYMGGFVSRMDRHPITTIAQLKEPINITKSKKDIRRTTYDEIVDKSKSDALGKGYALLQGGWFILQIFARFADHLPISELEIATPAYAVVNIFTWIIWWHKPYNVHQAIPMDHSPPSQTKTLNLSA